MCKSRLSASTLCRLLLVCLFLLLVSSGVNASPQDQYDNVIADCTRAIAENPRDENAYYSRGLAYAQKTMGRFCCLLCNFVRYSWAVQNPRDTRVLVLLKDWRRQTTPLDTLATSSTKRLSLFRALVPPITGDKNRET